MTDFNFLKKTIKEINGDRKIKSYTDLPEDFFNRKGEYKFHEIFGEFWKDDNDLFFKFNTAKGIFLLVKISEITTLIFNENEKYKKQDMLRYGKNGLKLLDDFVMHDDSILEQSLNLSSKDQPIDFTDQTVFLTDKYELYIQSEFSTMNIFQNQVEKIQLMGSLYLYAENLEILDTNYNLL